MRSLGWCAAGLAAVLLSGCWLQPGYGPAGQNSNPFETRITGANAATLAEAWSVDTPYGTQQPLVRSGRVYLGGTRTVGTTKITGVDALALADGAPRWSRDLVTVSTSIAVGLGPTFSGDELWMGALPPNGPTPTFSTEITQLDPADGTTLGSTVVDGLGGVPATSGDLTVELTTLGFDPASSTSRLTVRDLATRATRWTAELPLTSSGPHLAHGTIYLSIDGTLYAFAAAGCGAATCAPLAQLPVDGSSTALSVAQGHLLVVSQPALDQHRLTAFTPTAP
jgi:outer membrane protein assembly factor BamB